ncbi:DUF4908 domain-containing protein [Phenylobacterium sp.]|uniref:DUF4908 domain-containing protein n=1 Tax=Phenylobacterium sp. TaxID=1871053 RepID=UPI00272ADAFE|nr:DUF4908 domain-containing protein [Phenylobacterium sp.]
MISERPASASRPYIAAALAVAMSVGCALPAYAGPQTLRDGLFGDRPAPGRRATPPVARYVSQEGDAFILDRSQTRAFMKFEGSPEVWVLRPHPAPRGDVIYKNDLGEPMLRATRLGGLTLFTSQRPGGSPAAFAGGGNALRLAPLSPQVLLERLAQASAKATRAARRLIPFEADASPASSAVVADAAIVTAEAVVRLSRDPDGRNLLGRLRKVKLVEGKKPAVALHGSEMRITVSPDDGLAGRPSSDRIMQAAGAH